MYLKIGLSFIKITIKIFWYCRLTQNFTKIKQSLLSRCSNMANPLSLFLYLIIWDINPNWFIIKNYTCSPIFLSLQSDYNPTARYKN
jgi:hypothetical protein